MNIDKVLYNLKNVFEGGRSTDDVLLSDRQRAFILTHFRAELLAQKIRARSPIEASIQTIEMEVVRISNTDMVREMNKVRMSKTSKKIPQLITSNGILGLTYFGTTDFEFDLGKPKTALEWRDTQYLGVVGTEPVWKLVDGVAYIANADKLGTRKLLLSGYFSDPLDVHMFKGDYNILSGLSYDFKFPEELLGQLNNMVTQGEYRWNEAIPEDNTNDGIDES